MKVADLEALLLNPPRGLDEWFALNERLVMDSRAAIESVAPCHCGHEAAYHEGYHNRACHYRYEDESRCHCRRLQTTVIRTRAAEEWLALEATWFATIKAMHLSTHDVQQLLKHRYVKAKPLGD